MILNLILDLGEEKKKSKNILGAINERDSSIVLMLHCLIV